jgi:hypothetical protein
LKVPNIEGRLGAGQKCEVCGATSGVAKDDDGFACLVCGAPRVLVNIDVPRSFAETPYLVRANALKQRRRAWGIAAAFTLVGGVISTILGLFVSHFLFKDQAARAAIELLGIAPLAFAMLAFVNVRRTSAAVRSAVEDAELVVAEDVMRARGALDATELSRALGVTPARGEQLLARGAVDQFLLDRPGEQLKIRVEDDVPPGQQTPSKASENQVR